MQNTHRRTQLFGRVALVALLAAPALGAQAGGSGRWEDRDQRDSRDNSRDYPRDNSRDDVRRLFTWRGTVDGDMRIYVRGGNVRSVVNGNDSRGRRGKERIDEINSLPRRDGVVRVQLVEGRGRVYVVQQPNARNDYTAILRVMDWERGSDRYRFVVYFDPTDNGQGRRVDRGTVWGDVGGDVYDRDRILRWSGSVDGDLRISVWRGQVGYQVLSGQQPQNVRSDVGSQMTMRTGQLTVSVRQGRGSVSVIEQPSSFNNYTAVVRVLDSQGGYGYYDFDLIWR